LFAWGATTRAAQTEPSPIRLQAGTFTPAAGESLAAAPGLALDGYAAGARGYYIVQFAGAVREEWKAQLAAGGAELLDYIPDNAFKVRMTPAQASAAAGLSEVAWVGVFQPAYKISPSVDLSRANLLQVRVERGADAAAAEAAIAAGGATVLRREGNILLVGADAAQTQAIAGVLDVAWIEPYLIPEKHNEYGAGGIVGTNIANANGYDGSTQTAAVADTGLGGGTAATAHADIPAGRITSMYNWPGAAGGCFQTVTNDGMIDVDSGHGTHTAGSVLSDGGPAGEGKGGAPAAHLVFQATENFATITATCQILGGYPPNGYFLTGLPADLRNLYQQAYTDGARVHSNSWGSAVAGDYTLNSANTDDFIWTHRDMSITFSAGNAGVDTNNNGVVDNDSIGAPATAKNVLTVGASENARADNYPCDTSLTYTSHDAYQPGQTCASMGGQNILGTGTRFGFTTPPLSNDPTAGNAGQMAVFSSRGPTDDGRIKPDVVAPGTWILSGFSPLYQEGYGDPVNPQNNAFQWDGWGMPINSGYKYMGGTSMANPIAAGAATLVRDFYQKAHSYNASAALVKATIINSAVDMADENNDGANDNDFPIPNVHEGWGRVNVANATDNSAQFVDNTAGIGTSGSASYPFTISTAGQPFKVTLVWSDFASTETAALNLVNNLNLVVSGPGGVTYLGNVFSGGWSTTGGSADTINNVENVYVQSAAAGNWTVQVNGANVPNGPQPFAVVVDGALGDLITPTPSATPDPGSTIHVGDLDGSSTPNGNRWNANVVVTVHNGSEAPVANATVSGSWSAGPTGTGSCVTNASGQSTITKTNINGSVTSVTFSVTNVTAAGLTYAPGSNHDPDADSNGTSIIVPKTGGPTPTPTPSPTPPPGGVMHVGDLDGSSVSAPNNRWNATVTVTVHDAGHALVSGATVSGSWSAGASGSGSCVTNASGQCSVSKTNLRTTTNSVTFSVTNVSLAGSTYSGAANHDPEADSNGTVIVVAKP
jgi:hypothetical protein